MYCSCYRYLYHDHKINFTSRNEESLLWPFASINSVNSESSCNRNICCGQYVYQIPISYSLQKRWTHLTPLLVVNFNWESLTLAKVENSNISCKESCTNTLLSSEVKYWKWEQIVSCQLSAKLLSFPSKLLWKTAYNNLHLCNWLKASCCCLNC